MLVIARLRDNGFDAHTALITKTRPHERMCYRASATLVLCQRSSCTSSVFKFYVVLLKALRFHKRTNKDNLVINIDARRYVTRVNCT